MWKPLARLLKTRPRTPSHRPRWLALEWLEGREVPALTIQIDYSRDAAGFFNDPTRRAILQQAANDLGSQLGSSLAALSATAGESWSETFIDPSTGAQVSVANPTVAANTIVVYVGGRDLSGTEAGDGGSGGYSASGPQSWLSLVGRRGAGGVGPWGGSLAFDTSGTNWYFGSSAAGIGSNQVDFYSVAVHELGHVLGIGTSTQWFGQVSGGTFRGSNAVAAYGGAVPVYGDSAHWGNNVAVGGQRASMDPALPSGMRVNFTSLDFAALRDIGWGANGSGATSPPVSPPATGSASGSGGSQPQTFGAGRLGNTPASGAPVILTGDGTAQVYTLGAGGNLVPQGSSVTPFPGFSGAIRSAVGDFNGDGVFDYAFGTGAGVAAQLRVIDGKTGANLAGPTGVFEGFSGGVFLAAGDVDGDGAAELAVSADAGGGTRVTAFKVASGSLVKAADFIALDDPNFRGGSRIALGDINRDGRADLVVGAGIGGGPRVAIYDGATLLSGTPRRLVSDFFALDPDLRTGVFVTAADVDGDGRADLAYSVGPGGGPRVRVVAGWTLVSNPAANASGLPALADFFALNPDDRSGLRIAARDLDGDGRAEVVATGGGAAPQVRVLTLADMQSRDWSSGVEDPFTGPASLGLGVG